MKSFQRVLSSAGLAMALLGTAHAAPVSFGGSQYDVIMAEDITWTDANAAANALGFSWRLATITSAAENGFVASLLSTTLSDRSHFWLGGTDTAVEGTWTWGTGEAFSYTNWANNEPNNSSNEDYLAFDLRSSIWAWNDAPNDLLSAGYDFARGYIIERAEPTNVPEPGTLSLLGLAALAGGFASRKRAAA